VCEPTVAVNGLLYITLVHGVRKRRVIYSNRQLRCLLTICLLLLLLLLLLSAAAGTHRASWLGLQQWCTPAVVVLQQEQQ
jgi:hypothetical protein